MKNKQIAAVLFAAGLAVAGMSVPATAAPANNSIAVETALSEQNNNTQENDATVQTSEKPYETQGETPNDGEAPDNGETPTEQKTGFFYDETTQNWFLYQDDVLQSDFTGFYEGTINNITAWYYVENGSVDLERSGFIKAKLNDDTTENWYYVASGSADLTFTGLAKDTNGAVDDTNSLWYIKNGKISCETAVIDYDGTSWIINNGKVNTNANDFYRFNNTWYFVKDGQVQTDYTDVVKIGTDWLYFKNGVVPISGTTVAQNKNGWWYIKNGKVDFNYNGFAQNEDGWWYIRGGKVDFNYTGIAKNRNGWWRIVNGKVDFGCNSVEKNHNGWWALRGGKVDFSYNDVAQNRNGWWVINNGKVNFGFNGTYKVGIRDYYVSGGKVTGCNYYMPQNSISLPSGGYNLSTANIGLKVIKVNQAVCRNSSERYTSATERAVRNFQSRHRLSVTGYVDLTTWKTMGYSEYDWYNLGTYRTPMKVTYTSNRQDRINAMIQTAIDYKNAGTGYKVGCSGTPGSYVDCSGLIYQCLYAAGINPSSNIVDHALAIHEYTSVNLAADDRLGRSVDSNSLQRGDLVFYGKNGRNSVVHVAIYAGNGMIYDSWPGRGVTYRSVNIGGYHIVRARRVF